MNGRRLKAVLAMSGCAALLLGGCSTETRQKVLSFFFDGVPREGQAAAPPTRRVRRDLLQEIDALKRQLAAAQAEVRAARAPGPVKETETPVEEADTWDAAAKLLPHDAAGGVDWAKAITAGVITPRAGLAPNAPVQASLDMDVDLTSSAGKLFSVTYPHAVHTQWLSCANCHPAIFPLKAGTRLPAITMAMNLEGRACGVCHGRVAFGFEKHCARCHTRIPATTDWRPPEQPRKAIEKLTLWKDAEKLLPTTSGGPDWVKALTEGVIAPRPGIGPDVEDQPVFGYDVELVPQDNAAFKVVFPHGAHTTLLSCAACHPAIFQMAKGADPITMNKIYAGEYCGRCHGKVAFLPATACGRCHPVMAGG